MVLESIQSAAASGYSPFCQGPPSASSVTWHTTQPPIRGSQDLAPWAVHCLYVLKYIFNVDIKMILC